MAEEIIKREFNDGSVSYMLGDDFHREDGPAVTFSDGSIGWYLHGKNYVFSRYLEKLKKTKSDKEIMMLRLKYD
jgi:hypothetical protein